MSTNAAVQILATLGPSCRDTARRARLLAQTVLNGIDFIEFEIVAGANVLHVHFLLPLPAGAWGLVANPAPLRVHGGTRILGVAVLGAAISATDPLVLDVTVDAQGDYSPYLLAIGWSLRPRPASGATSSQRSTGCSRSRRSTSAPAARSTSTARRSTSVRPRSCPSRALDYLARDYASFRQLLLDLVAQRNPSWVERSPADVGIALLELFAYEGDHLSYFQDAVANETYLDTARQRVSAKRHARLIDYAMHDGRNAWTFVHLACADRRHDRPGPAARHAHQLADALRPPARRRAGAAAGRAARHAAQPRHATRTTAPIPRWRRCASSRPPRRVDGRPAEQRAAPARLGQRAVLPAARRDHGARLRDRRRRGHRGAPAAASRATTCCSRKCCGPDHRRAGRCRSGAPAGRAHRACQSGPFTSTVAAVDRMHDRCSSPRSIRSRTNPRPVTVPVPLALTAAAASRSPGAAADALAVPLCLTAKLADGTVVQPDLGGARQHRARRPRPHRALLDDQTGAITLTQITLDPPLAGERSFRLRLDQGPLTMQCQADDDPTTFPPQRERPDLTLDVRATRPAVALQTWRHGAVNGVWWPAPDLLSSPSPRRPLRRRRRQRRPRGAALRRR